MFRFLSPLCASLCTLALTALAAEPAYAQVPNLGGVTGPLGGVTGGLGSTPLGGIVNDATNTASGLTNGALRDLRNVRANTLNQLRREHRDVIDVDPHGDAVIRNEVLAIAPSASALAAAQTRGFSAAQTIDAGDLGVGFVVLRAPAGLSTRQAIAALRALDPSGAYDYNHLYTPSGAAPSSPAPTRQQSGDSGGARIGLIDSGADASALAGMSLRQRGFAAAEALADVHGTEVASLIGRAAPGANLYVADVYGGTPTGGGAAAIIAAFGWLAQQRTPVINVSLVGPPNRALEAAVRALVARGVVIVAAVGNDGPNAPPLYPASYPGVVGVTGVDARNRALPEAGRGAQVDFAAPGADMQAATPGGRSVAVRGTSYAAPIVAGLLSRAMAAPDPAAAAQAQTELARAATDLGSRGRDTTYGAGLVGADLRTQSVARR